MSVRVKFVDFINRHGGIIVDMVPISIASVSSADKAITQPPGETLRMGI